MVSVLLAVLAATPAQVKLAMPGLHLTDVPAARASFYTEQLATELIALGLRVVTDREMGALLGLERQKELLGCADASCMAELANALGADGIVLGDIAKVGNHFQVSLRVVDAKNGAALAVASFKASDEDDVVDGLAKAAAGFATDVSKALGRSLPPGGVSVGSTRGLPLPRRAWWVPSIAAVLIFGGAALCVVVSRNDYATLDPATPGNLTLDQAQGVAGRGSALQVASVVLWAAGGVATAFALLTGIFGTDTRAGVALTPGGGSVSLAGSWP